MKNKIGQKIGIFILGGGYFCRAVFSDDQHLYKDIR